MILMIKGDAVRRCGSFYCFFGKSLDKRENMLYNSPNDSGKEKNTEKMDGDGCISGDSKPPSTNCIVLRRHSRCLFEWERRLCLFVLS